MAYIRIKNVPYGSDNYYRYLVMGQREGDQVKQKVIAYLGPAKGPKDHSIHEDDELEDIDDEIINELGTTDQDEGFEIIDLLSERPENIELVEAGDGIKDKHYEHEFKYGDQDVSYNPAHTISKAETLEDSPGYRADKSEEIELNIHLPDDQKYPSEVKVGKSDYSTNLVIDAFEDALDTRVRTLGHDRKKARGDRHGDQILSKHTEKTLKADARIIDEEGYPLYLKPKNSDKWYGIAPRTD